MDSLPKLPALTWLGFAAAAAMLLGAFGPWGKVVGLVNVSVSGTDGSNDGWAVVVAALVGAGGQVAYMRGERWAGLAPLIAGIVAFAVTYSDRGNFSDVADDNTSDVVNLQVGWGLNLAMGASLVLGVVGLVALFEKPSGMTVTDEPLYRMCPNCKRSIPREESVCPHCKVPSRPYIAHADLWWVQADSGRWQYLDAEEKGWHWYEADAPGGPSSSPSSASSAAVDQSQEGADTTTDATRSDSPSAELERPPPSPPSEPPTDSRERQPAQSFAGELERLADLHARGALSDEEFESAKRRLLSS
jgi:hypothetical protein